MAEGYGACLIHKPELVADMIRQTRSAVIDPDFTVSIKIRIHKDYKHTVDFARQMEAAGASFITVHGRTQDQRSDPVCLDAIADIKNAVKIPVVANGDVRSMDDADRIQKITGVNGVMAARGILENPAMYAGYESTPLESSEGMERNGDNPHAGVQESVAALKSDVQDTKDEQAEDLRGQESREVAEAMEKCKVEGEEDKETTKLDKEANKPITEHNVAIMRFPPRAAPKPPAESGISRGDNFQRVPLIGRERPSCSFVRE
ncbi:tRNA-dihydrouridine synthase 4-like [Penaeus vannamei]|uniref:tRNA-dihydrouridine synthase 4-like n=1 Tax=Penaeus vannamei TaxID=6689 RepID=A0A423THG8_PENVA|nr:tRNA-dihydrouridine synthase 4-like [Penaeus vannamei]